MRLALITGGSRGLGQALCEQLLADGWHVLEGSRGRPQPYSVPLDLNHPATTAAAFDDALAQLPIDGLQSLLIIHNAGTLDPIGPASAQPEQAVLANLNTNLVSPILLLSHLVARFEALACRKRLVNISSGAAHTAYAGWSLYCAAKAGMEQFIRCLAEEQAAQRYPITPINIYPGVIDTAMQATIRATPEARFPTRERFVQRHLTGALQPPQRVAQAICNILARPDLQAGQRYDVADHWDT